MKLPDNAHPVEALVLAPIDAAIVERARKIRLMAFDVDGVLTDGRLWYGESGEIIKCFYSLDGHGLRLLREGGVTVALISGREGPIVARRAADLGISCVLQGIRDKEQALNDLAQEQGCTMAETGYMGDDIIDLSALQRAGFAASVPNAPAYVRQAVHWVASHPGGSGAVRECCDLILAAQGRLGYSLAPASLARSGPFR